MKMSLRLVVAFCVGTLNCVASVASAEDANFYINPPMMVDDPAPTPDMSEFMVNPPPPPLPFPPLPDRMLPLAMSRLDYCGACNRQCVEDYLFLFWQSGPQFSTETYMIDIQAQMMWCRNNVFTPCMSGVNPPLCIPNPTRTEFPAY